MNQPFLRFTPFHGLLLGALYLSQGLPSGLLAHALPVIMLDHGVDAKYIGFLKLLALPWFLKFLWAPLIDRYPLRGHGEHRGWILLLQTAVIALLFSLSLIPHEFLLGEGLFLFLGLLLFINLLSATQDIATDGLAVRILPPPLRGLGNSLQIGGYKLGMILSGNVLLISLVWLGWPLSFQALAAILLLATLPALFFFEPPLPKGKKKPSPPAATLAFWKESFSGFVDRPGVGGWILVLLTYKIADSFGSAMIKPLLFDAGLETETIATISLVAMICGIIAAFIGAAIYYRIGARSSLVLAGFLQAAGIAAYSVIPLGVTALPAIYGIAIFEQVADALSTVALFAAMMSYCRQGHEGGDYTIQASLHMTIAGTLGMLSGFVATAIGYNAHFMLAGCLGFVALMPAMTLAATSKFLK